MGIADARINGLAHVNGSATLDSRSSLREERIALRRKQVALAAMLIEQAERQATRLKENYDQWGWLGGYEDVIDRLRQPGKEMYAPMSTVNDRRHGHNWPFWRTWAEHARLRASARLLCTLSPIASGALTGLSAYVIGTGFTYHAASRQGQRAPRALVAAVQDVTDEFIHANDWCALESEGFERSRRDGELLLLHDEPERGHLAVEIVEPEQLQLPIGETEDEWSYGIETKGRRTDVPLSYHIVEDVAVPGEFFDATEMHHLKINVDRKIKRGLSDFAYDTHDAIRTAGRLVDHTGQGAAVQASIAFIRQHAAASPGQVMDFVHAASDYDRFDPISGRQEYSEKFSPGKILDIDAGQEYVVPPFSTNVGGYVEVIQAVLRCVASRWNAPEWFISADASNTNYASSVTAESPFVKRCYKEQERYKKFFLRSVWRAVLVAAAAGRVRAHGRRWSADEVKHLIEVQVEAPNVEVRDDFKTAQVDQIYTNMGVKSPQTIQGQLGLDTDQERANFAESSGPQAEGQQTQHGEQQQSDPDDPTATLRGSVGGSAALLQLQQAYFEGKLPRAACIANARIVYGFIQEDAEALFPEQKPDAPGAEEQQDGGGGLGGGLGGGDDQPPPGAAPPPVVGEEMAPPEDEGNPLDDVLFGGDQADQPDEEVPGMTEARRLSEDRRQGRDQKWRCFDDTSGRQIKCPPQGGEGQKDPKKPKAPAAEKKPRAAAKPKADLTSSPEKVDAALASISEAGGDPDKVLATLLQHNHNTVKDVAKLLGEKLHGGTKAIAQRLAALAGSKPKEEAATRKPAVEQVADLLRQEQAEKKAAPAAVTKKPAAKKPAGKKPADTRTPAEHTERLKGMLADTQKRYVEDDEANQMVAGFAHLSLADIRQVARDAGLKHGEKTRKGILRALGLKFTEARRAKESIEV